MEKNRLEAFSDGVLAIIITIMVLELKVPHSPDLEALVELWPVFLSYTLSFLYIGIYWNNHHHLLQAANKVNGAALWCNLHLLFWMSLLPFSTGWMGENHFAKWPTFVYGLNLLLCAVAYYLFQTVLVRLHGPDSLLVGALANDVKGKISPVLYVLGIVATLLVAPWAGMIFFVVVALIWLVPDRRIEVAVTEQAAIE